jgi:hypothetical protein
MVQEPAFPVARAIPRGFRSPDYAFRAYRFSGGRERLTPLEDRLARLLANPPARRAARGSIVLPILQAPLCGRSTGRCHPGKMGALRDLKFVRRRRWRGWAFCALWYPTEQAVTFRFLQMFKF